MGTNTTYKWLVAGGAFFALIAFFMAFFTINILGIPIGVSLSTLATLGGQFILFLLPIGMVAMIIFALIPANDIQQAKNYVIVQLASWIASILFLGIAIISLYTRLNQGAQFLNDLGGLAGDELLGLGDLTDALDMFVLTPGVGLFLFVTGNIAIIIGLIMAWNEVGSEGEYLPPIMPVPGFGDNRTTEVGDYPPPRQARRAPPKPKVQAWLTDEKGRSYQLNQGRTTVGRLAENDISISDDTVGRRHATINEMNGHFKLSDLDSRNGTWLNSQLLRKPTMLHPNDEIRFGDSFTVRFLAHGR